MTTAKRIADFIDTIPDSKIESSTILLGGNCKKPKGAPGTTNGNSCINGTFDGCNYSINRGSCKNAENLCNNSTNKGFCDNHYKRN